jgi:hypothetical protein
MAVTAHAYESDMHPCLDARFVDHRRKAYDDDPGLIDVLARLASKKATRDLRRGSLPRMRKGRRSANHSRYARGVTDALPASTVRLLLFASGAGPGAVEVAAGVAAAAPSMEDGVAGGTVLATGGDAGGAAAGGGVSAHAATTISGAR